VFARFTIITRGGTLLAPLRCIIAEFEVDCQERLGGGGGCLRGSPVLHYLTHLIASVGYSKTGESVTQQMVDSLAYWRFSLIPESGSTWRLKELLASNPSGRLLAERADPGFPLDRVQEPGKLYIFRNIFISKQNSNPRKSCLKRHSTKSHVTLLLSP
jgi:hypothetical protein